MPAHPVSRLVRFTLAVGTNVIFDHLGYRRPTVHPVRVIEAVELVACHVVNLAEQTRQRLTFGDVERYLAQLAAHPRRLWVWPLCAGAQGDARSGSMRSPAAGNDDHARPEGACCTDSGG